MLTEVSHGDAAGAAFNNTNDLRMTGRPGPGIERWHEIDDRNAARGEEGMQMSPGFHLFTRPPAF